MKRRIGFFALALLLALGAAAWAALIKQRRRREATGQMPSRLARDMMRGPGVTEQDKKAMRDFIQSTRAPQTMTKMMVMARHMGNGDVMLGMTRMMEMMSDEGGMMGARGGMMGGHGGVMLPPGAQPGK